MKKKNSIRIRLLSLVLTAVVCIGTAAGFCAHNMLQGKTVNVVNDNGETYVKSADKINMLQNIKDAGEKLVILEIVPFEYAGVMDMLVGTDDVINKIEQDKKKLYDEYKGNKTVSGSITTVTVKGGIASYHPFTISYDSSSDEYTVNYPNAFLDSFVDSIDDPEIYNYFKDNIEVRTVVARSFSEDDLDDVSLIYVSSKVEHKEVVAFNMYIAGKINADKTNDNLDNTKIGVYSKRNNRYTEYTISNATNIWYDDYVKSGNNYRALDISWVNLENVIEYVYQGNVYTEGKPIPAIVNHTNPDDYSANIYKLSVLLMKTTNENTSKINGMSTYYSTVLGGMKEYSGSGRNKVYYNTDHSISTRAYNYGGTAYNDWNATSVPLFDLKCNSSNEYLFNYVLKTSNSLSDAVFSIGNVNNYEITDNGSAYLRGVVGEDTDKYTTGDAIAYLLGYKKPAPAPIPPTPGPTEPTPPTPGPTPEPPAGDPEYVAEGVVRVLEIEPCRDFLYYYDSTASNTKKTEVFNRIRTLGQALNISEYSSTSLRTYSDYENLANKRITFKCVSTAEFNGLNEDLVASYDIIIIGSQTGTMSKDSSGNTIFNDKDLDGYIYLAFGDLIKHDDRLVGWLKSEYVSIDSYVDNGKINLNGYSVDENLDKGTTSWRTQKVIYSRLHRGTWSPLLMNNLGTGDFYVLQSISNKFSGVTNPSNYYGTDLGNARLTGNDITEKKLNELIEYVNIGRPVIMAKNLYTCVTSNNKTAYPTSKMYRLVNEKASNTNVISTENIATSLSGIMHRNTLKITDHSIKYNKNNMMVEAPEIKYVPADVLDSSGKITKYKGQVDASCIIENVEEFSYFVSFTANVGTEYYVKLIVDKNTDGRFNSEASVDDFNEVYSAKIIKAETENVFTDIDITLPKNYNGMFTWQILVEELDSRRNVVDAVSEKGYTVVKGETKSVKVLQIVPSTSCNLVMGDGTGDHANAKKTFVDLLKKSSDVINYNISVDIITADNFEKKFVGNKYTKGISYNNEENYLKANGYTMLVIGFADSFGNQDISDDYGALSCIVDFIENGNSVLFSHDTMTFVSSANAGITVKDYNSGSYNKTISTTDQWGERSCGSYILTHTLRDLVGMDRYSVTSITNLTAEQLEKANVPKDKDGNYITEIQGFSDYVLLRFTHLTNKYVSSRPASGLYTLVPVKGMESYLANRGAHNNSLTEHVEELNRGQISMYPFDTTSEDGTLKISKTHSQYYQLDMEDPDVVVWYTLTKKTSSDGKLIGHTTRDAANNYYIYSKGNITYSGAGHSSMSETEELKLFVNTVIRAAVAGNYIPTVDIKNGARTNDENTFVIFPNVMDERIIVQFVATDDDLADRENVEHTYNNETEILEHIGRFKDGKVYWITPEGESKVLYTYSPRGTYLLNGEQTTIYIYNPFAGMSEAAADAAAANASESVRNMYECFKEYKTEGLIELSIEATDYYNAKGSSTLKIIQHELFPLN